MHTKSIRGGISTVSVEIFKMENGKVIADWNDAQEVPNNLSSG